MKLVLATLHSRYSHASLALPSLAASCADLDGITTIIREWTIQEHHDCLLRMLVREKAELYGFSCYIWNVEQTLKLVADLKQVLPQAVIVLGGPEVSYGAYELMADHPAVDFVVRGEGEKTFRELVELAVASAGSPQGELLEQIAGLSFRVNGAIVATPERSPAADLDDLPSPFQAGLVDFAKPLVYLETSRGCPFSCAFCLSSRDRFVRSYSDERIRQDLSLLMERQVATIKLVDRTFNYDPARANDIWEFILRYNRSSRFHFEIAADLLTEDNLSLLRQTPEGWFRFEIGVQSGDAATLQRVGRTSNLSRLLTNIRRLRAETGVVVHLDLVAGLPGENFDGFLNSLELLLGTAAQHIQVEPLKVLKGTPMRSIAAAEDYSYSGAPPYKILRTPALSFEDITRIEDISRLLDLVYNSGRFPVFLQALRAEQVPLSTFFAQLSFFSGSGKTPQAKSLPDLCNLLHRFVVTTFGARPLLSDALSFDYCRSEYPSPDRLPLCFGDHSGNRGGRGPTAESAESIPTGARIRRYRRHFLRNYLEQPWKDEPVEVLFTYIAQQGKGERVAMKIPGDS